MPLKGIGKKVTDFLRSETMNKAIIAVVIIVILVFVSGSIYSLTAGDVLGLIFLRGGGIRVFIWTINRQTHAETMIIFLYYLMGFGGLWLYVNAATRSGDPRTTKYMLFFSFLLMLFAGLGLYSAFVAKFTGP
ncbi:MAG: hypothetical protein DRN49_00905 [Thaumarchaeota archaeon]|nr:MAG: hypothetical protein DRN49_00905 [Nitrososphaerota archaeon]